MLSWQRHQCKHISCMWSSNLVRTFNYSVLLDKNEMPKLPFWHRLPLMCGWSFRSVGFRLYIRAASFKAALMRVIYRWPICFKGASLNMIIMDQILRHLLGQTDMFGKECSPTSRCYESAGKSFTGQQNLFSAVGYKFTEWLFQVTKTDRNVLLDSIKWL